MSAAPAEDLNPESCFDIFANPGTYGISVPCILIIAAAWLILVAGLIVGIYFLVKVLVQGTPQRIARKRDEALQEASVEATSIAIQLGLDPENLAFVGRDRRRRLRIGFGFGFLGLGIGATLVMGVVGAQRITINNIQAQIPCNQTRVTCAGREHTASRFDITLNLPVVPTEDTATFEGRWMVVPFSSRDLTPGVRFCNPQNTGFNQCFLVNNGTGISVRVEVGSFRVGYTMSPVPDHTFASDYYLATNPGSEGNNCSAAPGGVYQTDTGCLAANCSCGASNYSQTMYPLTPQCGIFSFRRPFPQFLTWLRVTLTIRGVDHVVTLPMARLGKRARSEGQGVELEVTQFVRDLTGKFAVPRLDGGIVVRDWPSKLDSEWTDPARAIGSPGLVPMLEDWYYVSSEQRIDAYQDGVCGHNGVTSVGIYSNPTRCCGAGNYSAGGCIPDPVPTAILANLTSVEYVPPRPGGTVEGAYWPFVDRDTQLHLLREVQDFEVPSGVAPQVSIRATVSSDLISLLGRNILPGVDLKAPQCEYYFPDNIGVLRTRLCNAAYSKVILPLEQLRSRIQCRGLDAVNATIIDVVREAAQRFDTARCRDIHFRYNFTNLPSQLNFSSLNPVQLLETFRLNCDVNVTLKALQAVEDVLMHVLQGVQCVAVYRDSRQDAYFVGPAVPLTEAKKPPCLDDYDLMCNIDRGTLADDFFGPFFLVMTAVLLVFVVTFFPLYVRMLEDRNNKRNAKIEKHTRKDMDLYAGHKPHNAKLE